MKAHDGEILERLLSEFGIKKSKLAVVLGIHRNSITNMLHAHTIPDERLLQIGAILKVDMAKYYKRLDRNSEASQPTFNVALEGEANYGKSSLLKCYAEVEYWRNKAYENLEKYNSLLLDYNSRFTKPF